MCVFSVTGYRWHPRRVVTGPGRAHRLTEWPHSTILTHRMKRSPKATTPHDDVFMLQGPQCASKGYFSPETPSRWCSCVKPWFQIQHNSPFSQHRSHSLGKEHQTFAVCKFVPFRCEATDVADSFRVLQQTTQGAATIARPAMNRTLQIFASFTMFITFAFFVFYGTFSFEFFFSGCHYLFFLHNQLWAIAMKEKY